MSINIITGPSKSGKTLIANALRNNQISNKKGALLIDENNDGEPKILLEKLLVGAPFPEVVPNNWGADLPWKNDPMIILIGDQEEMLAIFEKMLPGFVDHFGPVYKITTEAG